MKIFTFILSLFFGIGFILVVDASVLFYMMKKSLNPIYLCPYIATIITGFLLWSIPLKNLIDSEFDEALVLKNRLIMSFLFFIMFSISVILFYLYLESILDYKDLLRNLYLNQLIASILSNFTFISVFFYRISLINTNY